MHTKQGLTPIVLVIIVVLLLGGGYVAYQKYQQPTTDNQSLTTSEKETAESAVIKDWKTYRNEKFGFEFTYPSDKTAYSSFDAVKEILHPATPDSNSVVVATNEKRVFCCEPITLSITVTPQQTLGSQVDSLSKKTINFGGRVADEYRGAGNLGSIYRMIRVRIGASDITITQNAQDDMLDEILATFRFFKPVDTSHWKTYRNDEFGFEFQHPTEWEISKEGDEEIILSNPTLTKKSENSAKDAPSPIWIVFERTSDSLETWLQGVEGIKDISIYDPAFQAISTSEGFAKFERGTVETELPGYAFRKSGVNYYILTSVSFYNILSGILSTFKFTK